MNAEGSCIHRIAILPVINEVLQRVILVHCLVTVEHLCSLIGTFVICSLHNSYLLNEKYTS